MSKHKRPDWRKLPPKLVIYGRGRVKATRIGVDFSLSGSDSAHLIIRGFMDTFFGHSVAKRGDVYEHTYTLTSMDEPFQVTVVNEAVKEERRYKAMFPPDHRLELEMRVTDADVSFALYNQLIVMEPPNLGVDADRTWA